MSDALKTTCFVGVAVVLAAAAGVSHWMNQPSNSAEFELVGQPFFEEFDSADLAKSLEVVGFNQETTELNRFSVEENEGLWTIPSHYNYPAEAVDRLAKTATSVMGIEREALVGRLESEHERLGVLDPLDEDLDDPENAGQRITMKDESGEVVLDLIIGNEVEEPPIEEDMRDFENMSTETLRSYYVRRPDEQQTYQVRLDIDLSTKFSDWIDPDLLQINRSQLTKISIDNYSLEDSPTAVGQSTLVKSQGDQLSLNKSDSGWKLDGMDENTETLETSKVEQLLGVLDEMEIAGVRPKYKYKDHLLLTPDLQLNDRPEFKENPQEVNLAIREMQADLAEKGFNLASVNGQMGLVSIDGDIKVGTNEGVLYTLNVGAAVEGTEEEIEVGGTSKKSKGEDDAQTEDDKEAAAADKSEANGEPLTDPDQGTGEEAEDDSDAMNRYLMIRVAFEESLVAEKPTMPVEPVKPLMPEGYQSADGKAGDPSAGGEAAPSDVDAPPGAEEAGGCGGQEPEQEASTQSEATSEKPQEETVEQETENPTEAEAKQPVDEKVAVQESEGEVQSGLEKEPKAGQQSSATKETDAGADKKSDPEMPKQEPEGRNPEFVAYEAALKAYEAKLDEYNLAKVKYEEDMKSFQKRVELGEKQVAMLNERFADWYYVISANNLKLLKMNRDELVKVKQPGSGGAAGQGQPPMSMPNIPGLTIPRPSAAEEPATEKPDVKEVDAEKPEEPDSEKADAEKPDAEKVDGEKPDAEKVETEKVETEKVETEKVETEKVETEKVETEKVDGEKVDGEKPDVEKVDTEKVDGEKVDAEKVEAEKAQVEKADAK